MTHKEIEDWPQELAEILKKQEPEKRRKLLAFAKQVGASQSNWARIGGESDATESQLVDNIQRAIQTVSIVNMCRTAGNNYRIALIATIIAVLSMLATWAAVVVMVLAK